MGNSDDLFAFCRSMGDWDYRVPHIGKEDVIMVETSNN